MRHAEAQGQPKATKSKEKDQDSDEKVGQLTRVEPTVTPPIETFWSLTATGWTAVTAIATVALVVATVILAVVAYVQLSAARVEALAAHNETRCTRTLAVCDRYDLDPILDAACRRLREAQQNGDLNQHPEKYRVELNSLFNYLETIAIGIDRELYDGGIVRDMMEPIFLGHVQEYIFSGLVIRSGPPTGGEEDFHRLRELCRRWEANP